MMKRVGVIGAGQMGLGIAQVCATSGYQVTLVDVNKEQLQRAKDKIAQSTQKLSEKGVLNSDQIKNISAINYGQGIDSLRESVLVIEAATEDETIKTRIFKERRGVEFKRPDLSKGEEFL